MKFNKGPGLLLLALAGLGAWFLFKKKALTVFPKSGRSFQGGGGGSGTGSIGGKPVTLTKPPIFSDGGPVIPPKKFTKILD